MCVLDNNILDFTNSVEILPIMCYNVHKKEGIAMKIIHITDIHLKADDSNTVLNKQRQIISACNTVLQSTEKVILLISGDIAYSGSTSEYQLAESFIDNLKNSISNICKVVIVPGNHDCDFSVKNSIRNRLLSTITDEDSCDCDLIPALTTVQSNFLNFVTKYHNFNLNSVYNSIDIVIGDQRVHFNLINSAWMSTVNEKPGQLFLPTSDYLYANPDDYDFTISVMHHPLNWFHPDNCNNLVSKIRQDSDILIMGHEHIVSHDKLIDDNSALLMLKGKELQDSSNLYSSGFSIYDIKSDVITIHEFNWQDKGQRYTRCTKTREFQHNKSHGRCSLNLDPYFSDYLRDAGADIKHYCKEDIQLEDIFIWPEAEESDIFGKVSSRVYSTLNYLDFLDNKFSIISGNNLSGKTTLLKMLFTKYLIEGKCCILIDGTKTTCSRIESLSKIIDSLFIEQYSKEQLDIFQDIPMDNKIILIDNFDSFVTSHDLKIAVLDELFNYFGNIIMVTDNIDNSMVFSKYIKNSDILCKQYRLLPLGNLKRKEFVENWYSLGNVYTSDLNNFESNVSNACSKLTDVLGKYSGLLPATPIYVLSILQGLELSTKDKYKQSQYGFLYESLVNRSLASIAHKYESSAYLNIDVNIMCLLAYKMLCKKQDFFNYKLFETVATEFANDKLVDVCNKDLYDRMVEAKIIVATKDENTYTFKYPYMFYYFTGKYIAFNINNTDVTDVIKYMCQRLYNEKYSNIVIFVCHFADSDKVIDIILKQAQSLFSDTVPFSFRNTAEFYKGIQDKVEHYSTPVIVGTNEEVNSNINKYLKKQDALGVHDGSVTELGSTTEEYADNTLLAIRTIDVLGQILCNYPGSLDGEVKQQILRETHDLGMRMFAHLTNVITDFEQDFYEDIKSYVENTEEIHGTLSLVYKMVRLIKVISTEVLHCTLKHISRSINNKALGKVIDTVTQDANEISYNLIQQDLWLNMFHKLDYEKVICLYKKYKKSNPLAAAILRDTVINYLLYNKCPIKRRQQLCSVFNVVEHKVITGYYKKKEIE